MFRFWYFDPGYISHTHRAVTAGDVRTMTAWTPLGPGEYIIYES